MGRSKHSGGGKPEAERDARCPRCGYDLMGLVDSWTESCPLDGVCSECGLTVAWRDVFNPLRDVPVWLFEFAERRLFRRLVWTVMLAFVPWVFWRRVKIEFPVRSRRLGVALLVLAALAYMSPVVIGAAGFVAELRVKYGMSVGEIVSWYAVDELVMALAWPIDLYNEGSSDLAFFVWGLTSVIMPVCFVTLPRSLGKARVRAVHFVRATAYTLAPLLVIGWVWGVVQTAAWSLMFRELLPYNKKTDWIWQFAWLDWTWAWWWPVWMLAAWWSVCRWYLRVAHAFWVALLLLVMAMLLTPIVLLGFGVVLFLLGLL